MKEFIIEENEAGQRFDKYLAKLLREAPKSFFLQNAPQKEHHSKWKESHRKRKTSQRRHHQTVSE